MTRPSTAARRPPWQFKLRTLVLFVTAMAIVTWLLFAPAAPLVVLHSPDGTRFVITKGRESFSCDPDIISYPFEISVIDSSGSVTQRRYCGQAAYGPEPWKESDFIVAWDETNQCIGVFGYEHRVLQFWCLYRKSDGTLMTDGSDGARLAALTSELKRLEGIAKESTIQP